jgi:hypothetical protein
LRRRFENDVRQTVAVALVALLAGESEDVRGPQLFDHALLRLPAEPN